MFYNGSYDTAFNTINYDQFIDYQGLRFCKKNKITYQWQHQFCRSKVIKTMFDCLDEPEFPKQLDHMQKEEKSKPVMTAEQRKLFFHYRKMYDKEIMNVYRLIKDMRENGVPSMPSVSSEVQLELF